MKEGGAAQIGIVRAQGERGPEIQFVHRFEDAVSFTFCDHCHLYRKETKTWNATKGGCVKGAAGTCVTPGNGTTFYCSENAGAKLKHCLSREPQVLDRVAVKEEFMSDPDPYDGMYDDSLGVVSVPALVEGKIVGVSPAMRDLPGSIEISVTSDVVGAVEMKGKVITVPWAEVGKIAKLGSSQAHKASDILAVLKVGGELDVRSETGPMIYKGDMNETGFLKVSDGGRWEGWIPLGDVILGKNSANRSIRIWFN